MAVNVSFTKTNTTTTTTSFNHKIRSRIFNNSLSYTSSSGSEHDAETDVVSPLPSPSPCLSFLVQTFLEDDPTTTTAHATELSHDSDSDELTLFDPSSLINSVINPIVHSNADRFQTRLLGHVTRGVEIFSIFRKNKSIFNRNLMAYLREIGYNAGVCKTRWDATPGGGLPAGNYDFIDVISPEATRYIIDGEFSGEFLIARESGHYRILREALPKVFVGKGDDLRRILRLMCDEARRSMKINGLSLPPWRKNRYMQAKWLGAYKRSSNHLAAAEKAAGSGFVVKCRAVGFDISGDGGRVLVAPATRTR